MAPRPPLEARAGRPGGNARKRSAPSGARRSASRRGALTVVNFTRICTAKRAEVSASTLPSRPPDEGAHAGSAVGTHAEKRKHADHASLPLFATFMA